MGYSNVLGTLYEVYNIKYIYINFFLYLICSQFLANRNPECRRLASSSKDGDVRIWDTVTGFTILSLTGHSKAVTCVKWGGTGLIYTSSQDRTIRVNLDFIYFCLVII